MEKLAENFSRQCRWLDISTFFNANFGAQNINLILKINKLFFSTKNQNTTKVVLFLNKFNNKLTNTLDEQSPTLHNIMLVQLQIHNRKIDPQLQPSESTISFSISYILG